jgi:hypothetical protein
MQFGIIVALSVRHKFFVIDGGSGSRPLARIKRQKSFCATGAGDSRPDAWRIKPGFGGAPTGME